MNDILSIFDKIDTTYVMKKYKVGQLNKHKIRLKIPVSITLLINNIKK